MPEKRISEVPRGSRELYEKGNAAFQRQNLDYAIQIFNQVLRNEPGFYECREALRVAQYKKQGDGKSFFKKMLGTASSSPLLARGQLALRSNPLEAIQLAEQILNNDPQNTAAHKLLAEAALAADLPRTAVLSLEIVRKIDPRDREINMQLGEALARAGQAEKAESVYRDLLSLNPADNEVNQRLKDLAARRTMDEGGYEAAAGGEGSYRDLLRDKEQSVLLEQEKREHKSEDVADRLITEYEAQAAADPKNLKLLRSLAELYTQKNQFDRALSYYNQIISQEGAADSSLEKAIAETTTRKIDHEIAQLDPKASNYEAEVARLQQERRDFLLQDAERRAAKYPNDLQIRFELGKLYFETGRVGQAIQEFQKAQANPHRRIQALNYLGQCFALRGMNDLAAKTLQNAIREKLVFDDEKKELIYALGSVYDKMGKTEDAIEQYKQIYEIDIGYKDVAAKVDAYYAGK